MIELEDEYLNCFFEYMGESTTHIIATEQEIESYRGKLPDQLLEYWNLLGFSGFADGLFWLTNPIDYQDILDRFLENTPFEELDIYHVIARNAWGDLQIFGEKTGRTISIFPNSNWIITKKGDEKELSQKKSKLAIQKFIFNQEPERLDIKNNKNEFMFEKALKKHKPLNSDEMYGFTPFLFSGGDKDIKKIQKCDIFAHLNLIADMGDMEIIDMASMVNDTINNQS